MEGTGSKTLDLITIRAGGGIVVRAPDQRKETLVMRRIRYGNLRLPTGKLEKGKTFESAALREVREEAGVVAKLGSYAGSTTYRVQGRPKIARYWRVSARTQEGFEPNEEIAEVVWMECTSARRVLSHSTERNMLRPVMNDRSWTEEESDR